MFLQIHFLHFTQLYAFVYFVRVSVVMMKQVSKPGLNSIFKCCSHARFHKNLSKESDNIKHFQTMSVLQRILLALVCKLIATSQDCPSLIAKIRSHDIVTTSDEEQTPPQTLTDQSETGWRGRLCIITSAPSEVSKFHPLNGRVEVSSERLSWSPA